MSADGAGAAREQARDILSDGRYREPSLPQPLRGPFERLGDLLTDAARPVGDLLRDLADVAPGGNATLVAVGVAAVALVAGLAGTRLARRRAEHVTRARTRTAARQETAASLRRAADDAERAGDLERALRLRFRAGLVELGERGLLDMRPALPHHEVRALRSPTLDELLERFEQVTYGGRAAAAEDLEASRAGWERVPEEVGR
jgi:hypothetical protein